MNKSSIFIRAKNWIKKLTADNILENGNDGKSLKVDSTRLGQVIALLAMMWIIPKAVNESVDVMEMIKQLMGPGVLMALYSAKKFRK